MLGALTALGLAGAPVAGAVTIDEFPIDDTPTGIVAGPDGNMYVTTTAPSILQVSPAGTVTARYPLTANGAPTPSRPVFSGGTLWYVLQRGSFSDSFSLGRRTSDGTTTELPLPTPTATVTGLTPGTDGNVWLTESGTKNAVGRVTPSGQVTELPVAGEPTSIARDATGQLWITLFDPTQSVARVSNAGVVDPAGIRGGMSKVVTSPSSPDVWFLGEDHLTGYSAPWTDFAYVLSPGATGSRISAGFLSTAYTKDIAVGPDGNAWITDRVFYGPSAPDVHLGALRIGRVSPSGRTATYSAGLAADTQLSSIATGPTNTVWFTDISGRVGRVTLDHPIVLTGDASDASQTGATVSMTVTPRGTASRVRVEYGTTTAYGDATRWYDVGEGDGPVSRAPRLDSLAAGTTYHYRAVVTSMFGPIAGPDRTFTTDPPPPPPPVPPTDADEDGYSVAIDCDDHKATIYPGASERPGDGIDQDCSGADEPLPRFFPNVGASFKNKRGHWSRATAFVIDDLPAHAGIALRCTGGGCRFARWSTTVRRATDELDLRKRLAGSSLRAGAVLELRLTLPGHIGTVIRWRVGPPARPTVTCLAPGAKEDRRC
jgi:streptogramin lyase